MSIELRRAPPAMYDVESVFWVWLLFLVKRAGGWQEQIQRLDESADLAMMSANRTQFILQDFWDEFSACPRIHPSLRNLLSELRLYLFYDRNRGPSFKYQASRWKQTNENVRDRLEYLAGLFEKCADELDKEDKAIGPPE
jgi:hypothetical protein